MTGDTMREFGVRKGFHLKKEVAQKYGEEIDRIMTNGTITAEQLLEAAKNPDSPLHQWFNWRANNSDGGRVNRARVLLRSLTVTVPGTGKKKIRAYPFICGCYVDVRRAYGDSNLRDAMRDDAAKKFKSASELYHEEMEAIDAIEEIRGDGTGGV
jgi:hypothetical protein